MFRYLCLLFIIHNGSINCQERIKHGRPATKDENGGAVLINVETKDDHKFMCSGAVVRADLVLTAAHCCGTKPKDANYFKVYVGIAYTSFLGMKVTKSEVAHGDVCNSYIDQLRFNKTAGDYWGHDLCMLVLCDKLDKDNGLKILEFDFDYVPWKPFPPEHNKTNMSTVNQMYKDPNLKITALGYGKGDQKTFDELRAGDTFVHKCPGKILKSARQAICTIKLPMLERTWPTIASGDSGGPIIHKGKIIGVSSGILITDTFATYVYGSARAGRKFIENIMKSDTKALENHALPGIGIRLITIIFLFMSLRLIF